MKKKYTIVIDTVVTDEKAIEHLAEGYEQIAENAEVANAEIIQLNKGIEKNTIAVRDNVGSQREMSEGTKKTVGVLGQFAGAAAASWGRTKALHFAAASFARFIPIIGTAIAIVTATIVLYNKALASANDYLDANVEAQQKMFSQTGAATAWANIWKDVSIWFGEFFHSFRDFWSFFKNITGQEILKGIGLENYVFEAEAAIEAQKRLNFEWEASLTKIQELTYASEDYLKIVNDENQSNEDRLKAAAGWVKVQFEILDINKQKIKDEKTLLENLREKGPEEDNQIEQLNRRLAENERLRLNVSVASAEMTKNILLGTEAVNINTKAIEDNTGALASWWDTAFDITDEDRAAMMAALEQREEWNRQFNKPFDIGDEEEEVPEDPAVLEIEARKLKQQEYAEWLESNLQDLGGMWGDYFGLLKDLYAKDVNFSDLSNKEKMAAIAMTAQATLQVAGNLVNQLGSIASDDFETQKKYRIAGATISTLSGMIAAFMGGVSTIPGPAGVALGAVLAGLTGYAGYKNIEQIKNSQPGGGGGSMPSMSGGGSGAITAAPSLSLVSPVTPGEEGIIGAIGAETNDPMRAFVVSSDVTSSQELERNIQNNATL